MADFTSSFHSFKPSFSFLDVDPNIELMNNFPEINPSIIEPSNMNFQSYIGFSSDNLFTPQVPEFPGNLAENFPGFFHREVKNVMPVSAPLVSTGNDFQESNKRKETEVSVSSSGNSTHPVSENRIKRKNSSARGKRTKRNEEEGEKPMEVVHVRARRGQATDSHSLAERVRRGKINERLRCLQDIVPGCYKTMGMAVMLDEIINYVQSLQNQVEFLSMKLTEASTFHDFNSETEQLQTIQRTKTYKAQKVQRVMRGGHEQVASSQIGPLDHTFGSYPSLPYNT